MVLQQAPNLANVWGYTSDCDDKVTVNFNQDDYQATMITGGLHSKVRPIYSGNKSWKWC